MTKSTTPVDALMALVDRYWELAYAEGKEGRDHDTESGEAQAVLSEIRATAAALSHLSTPQGWQQLTDEDRERAMRSMPDMLDGFMKTWGWLHFAKAIEAICREKNAAPPPPEQGGKG